ncbi:uncharacterized protein LOC128919612 [Rissa tridactyla]|uniref:uncharacterized protein LOC128919612 n=1 Tax=Rissa tridactyla TaxID=75485 RepID=UPI0023BAD199|nr:uncharacterized protein LOC128919612 [Rissa tridactyla]
MSKPSHCPLRPGVINWMETRNVESRDHITSPSTTRNLTQQLLNLSFLSPLSPPPAPILPHGRSHWIIMALLPPKETKAKDRMLTDGLTLCSPAPMPCRSRRAACVDVIPAASAPQCSPVSARRKSNAGTRTSFCFVPVPSCRAPRAEGQACRAAVCDGRGKEKKRRGPAGPAPPLWEVVGTAGHPFVTLQNLPSHRIPLEKQRLTQENFMQSSSKPVPGHEATLDVTTATGMGLKLPGDPGHRSPDAPHEAPQPFPGVFPLINTF